MKGTVLWAALTLALQSGTASEAQVPHSKATFQRPVQTEGTVLVPDRFLRRWDPVTIFFDQDTGPPSGGPEDHPERLLTLTPDHPGAFSWIDARTLQFRPADPWPPLARFEWQIGDFEAALSTLMEPPSDTIPAAGAADVEKVEQISLTFAQPLDVEALEQMVRIELRPRPGLDRERAQWLDRGNFQIKVVERRNPSDQATYVLALNQPLPEQRRVLVHLRLSLDDDSPHSFHQTVFTTAQPFRALRIGCAGSLYPITPGGSGYPRDQILSCRGSRAVQVYFSAPPERIDPILGRNLVRFTPAVDNLEYQLSGEVLEIGGDFEPDTEYRLNLVPAPLRDKRQRPLDQVGQSELYLYFPRQRPFLRWKESQGVVERLGPQMVPVEGRAQERLDLRIYPLDPLDRSFWPFPRQPVAVDESQRPPGPGEEPPPFRQVRMITPAELSQQLSALGAPPFSRIVQLPLRRDGKGGSFGLDLAPHLQFLSGQGAAGHYLVGIRRLDGGSARYWMRVQATDLALTAAEEPLAVRFAVSSLSTGRPVPGARIRLEGVQQRGRESSWVTFADLATNLDGTASWPAPGASSRLRRILYRIVVEKNGDSLVLNTKRPPDHFTDNQWHESRENWLQWAFSINPREPDPVPLAHIFTERPVYRPEEDVHIKGWLRNRDKGRLSRVSGDGFVVVDGPGEQSWRYPVTLDSAGGFYQRFAEENLPSGSFTARFELKNGRQLASLTFKKEAYRIPRFEVQLHGPDQTPLDREFQISLTAEYYAGGRVAGQPVRWRVTQFPYTWTPEKRPGFFYSSDSRFSRQQRFESTPRLEKEDVTDAQGGALLTLNPAIEPTAQPRSYVVEATLTGADEQTVTATRRVQALPPFVLGLKVPRYLERAERIQPEILVAGPDGQLLEGQQVTVRLLHRQWHSYLRAGDFSDGEARYITDVVDVKVSETQLSSASEPLQLDLPIERAGVYVVELEAHDQLGRAQVVSVDLYAGGEEPVAWQKPINNLFTVSTDQPKYRPGQDASMVLQSPYQTGEALVVVEAPEGNLYGWLPVRNGTATYSLPILDSYTPRLPVHFVLMRGRLEGTAPSPANGRDLGKPATVASTTWLEVDPLGNRVEVALNHPARALPGQEIEVEIQLRTPQGDPLSGQVCLWFVDQAVLSLGQEQRLDPLPDFLPPVFSRLRVRDTRNSIFGWLPLSLFPGGGEGDTQKLGLFDRVTVRKDFRPVPYFNPAIEVGPAGNVRVRVKLADSLTVFKVRAKAAAGPDRFGYAASEVAVRLPVIVQPALPRFARPGDRFRAAAIGRVVEGPGGPGSASLQVEGVILSGAAQRSLDWTPNQPQRIEFEVTVPTPTGLPEERLREASATFRVAVERDSDRARDAFEVVIPVRDDRRRLRDRVLEELVAGTPLEIPALTRDVRPGTLHRSVLVSDQPGLVGLAAGLDFLLEYPYGCTEQRLSRVRSQVALKEFRQVLQLSGSDDQLEKAVADTLQWIKLSLDTHNLVAYWPGSQGFVHLTAWTVQFLVEARSADLPIDEPLLDSLTASLERALRSDYSHFVSGEAYTERAWALRALADAGRFNAAYAAELARRSQFLNLEAAAQVLTAFDRSGTAPEVTLQTLSRKLWNGVVFRLFQGREIYGGLQSTAWGGSHLVLPSETRTTAEVTRALARVQGQDDRLQVLVNGLVTLGREDGWGTTNANASALLALTELVKPPFSGASQQTVEISWTGGSQSLQTGPEAPVAVWKGQQASRLTLSRSGGGTNAVVARVETSYIPAGDGSQVEPESRGFVVSREALLVQQTGRPAERIELQETGMALELPVSQVVEEHVRVVNPEDRFYVAVVIPLAAGLEPLNPSLATAPPEARPEGRLTLQPTYAAYLDDQVAFYYNSLPKGTYDFYFRTRAVTQGSFIQPPAHAQMMYDEAVRGNSYGVRVEIR